MRYAVLPLIVWTSMLGGQSGSTTARSTWFGVYSSDQAARGRVLYDRYCASCHLPDLDGRPSGAGLFIPPDRYVVPRPSPALDGYEFQANWTSLTLWNLFERIRISMPQDAPGSLTRQQNVDIVAYILERNAYPAGSFELPPSKDVLDWITVEQ
jgi:cytochrome c